MARMLLSLAVVAVACSLGGTARADGGGGGDSNDDDARASARCTGASTGQLRLRAEDGRLRVELELRSARRGAIWNVVVLHERRLVARFAARASRDGGSLRVRRSAPDWFGADGVVVRATRSGESCRAAASV